MQMININTANMKSNRTEGFNNLNKNTKEVGLAMSLDSSIADDHPMTDITAMDQDGLYLFMTAYDAATEEPVMVKIDKHHMQVMSKYKFDIALDGTPFALQVDVEANMVVTGHGSSPGGLVKFSAHNFQRHRKLDLPSVQVVRDGATVSLEANDVRTIITKGSLAYCGTNTDPGQIHKVHMGVSATDAFTHHSAIALNQGEKSIMAMMLDPLHPEFIYVGLFSSPGKIVIIHDTNAASGHAEEYKEDNPLVRIGNGVELYDGEGHPVANVDGLAIDNSYVYASCDTTPAKVVRVSKLHDADGNPVLSSPEVLSLSGGNDMAGAMVASATTLFVGTETLPAKVVALSGVLKAVDCDYSEWSAWSPCSVTCETGVRSRNRTIFVHGVNGGEECGDTTDEEDCNELVVCPPDEGCSDGKVWTKTGSTIELQCSDVYPADNSPVITPGEEQKCQCPVDRPYWHGSINKCVDRSTCEKGYVAECPTSALTCTMSSTNVLKVARVSTVNITDYHCFSPRSDDCLCLCKSVNNTVIG